MCLPAYGDVRALREFIDCLNISLRQGFDAFQLNIASDSGGSGALCQHSEVVARVEGPQKDHSGDVQLALLGNALDRWVIHQGLVELGEW